MNKLLAAAAAAFLAASSLAADGLEGRPAPDFSLQDQYGEWRGLADFHGQWLVVFFYPRADTPGCTAEACNFRDNIYAFRGQGAEVVGISVDPVDDQRAFSDKYRLPFAILSDSDGEACGAYGVLREFRGQDIANRESFLINPEGKVVRHYARVDPETHTQEVLADLERFQSGD